MAAQAKIDVGGILRPQGRPDFSTALHPYAETLGERGAAHLLRRAGFGGTPDDVRRYAGMSARAAVASLLSVPSVDSIAPPPELVTATRPPAVAMDPMQGSMYAPQMPRRRPMTFRQHMQVILALQLWWMNRMLTSPAPLQEKMTLYFHGHFTTIATPLFPRITYNYNALLRRYALGNLRELTRDVSKDVAMLIYLNGAWNVAAHPNENYARELMELFTLGIGAYTENDVRESARAWTGWTINRRADTATFDPALHDSGSKTFLGRTGNFTGDDIVNIIFAQPQCARFFAASLLNWFVYNDPEPQLVDGVAALLRKHDFELAPVVSAILSCNVFYSPRAYRALVKSPVEFVVGTYKALGLSAIDQSALPALVQMGQRLFFPPNVAGWPGGQNWLTSGTMIARQNFLTQLLGSETLTSSSWLRGLPVASHGAARQLAQTILQGDVAPASLEELEAYLGGAGSAALASLSAENYDQRVSGAVYLAMATPAYQLN
ncbi:MAG TPA: DUF1800 domain-containing protein [Candidatus Cybelea sp.]|jgi:uncharacterized protein (DUF1800 family)|nr:DUF1800 domain-containing protein [Candidatus Cybelea sp.]